MEGEVRQQAGAIADTSKEVLGSVKEAGAEIKEGLRASAHEVAGALKRESRSFVDEQKHRISAECSGFGRVARDAAQRYRDENYRNIAAYADTFADKVDAVARYIDETPVNQMIQDIEDRARERPELFLGGMVLLGIVAARFFRASSPSPAPYGYYQH